MIIQREKETFRQITLTLTSQEELDVLVASLNASKSDLKDSWECLRFGPSDQLNHNVATEMYNQVIEFYGQEIQ